MKKTFCDKCGSQCINTTINITIVIVHHTNDYQYVGSDEHKPIEICLDCCKEIAALIPQAFTLAPKEDFAVEEGIVNERAEARMPR